MDWIEREREALFETKGYANLSNSSSSSIECFSPDGAFAGYNFRRQQSLHKTSLIRSSIRRLSTRFRSGEGPQKDRPKTPQKVIPKCLESPAARRGLSESFKRKKTKRMLDTKLKRKLKADKSLTKSGVKTETLFQSLKNHFRPQPRLKRPRHPIRIEDISAPIPISSETDEDPAYESITEYREMLVGTPLPPTPPRNRSRLQRRSENQQQRSVRRQSQLLSQETQQQSQETQQQSQEAQQQSLVSQQNQQPQPLQQQNQQPQLQNQQPQPQPQNQHSQLQNQQPQPQLQLRQNQQPQLQPQQNRPLLPPPNQLPRQERDHGSPESIYEALPFHNLEVRDRPDIEFVVPEIDVKKYIRYPDKFNTAFLQESLLETPQKLTRKNPFLSPFSPEKQLDETFYVKAVNPFSEATQEIYSEPQVSTEERPNLDCIDRATEAPKVDEQDEVIVQNSPCTNQSSPEVPLNLYLKRNLSTINETSETVSSEASEKENKFSDRTFDKSAKIRGSFSSTSRSDSSWDDRKGETFSSVEPEGEEEEDWAEDDYAVLANAFDLPPPPHSWVQDNSPPGAPEVLAQPLTSLTPEPDSPQFVMVPQNSTPLNGTFIVTKNSTGEKSAPTPSAPSLEDSPTWIVVTSDHNYSQPHCSKEAWPTAAEEEVVSACFSPDENAWAAAPSEQNILSNPDIVRKLDEMRNMGTATDPDTARTPDVAGDLETNDTLESSSQLDFRVDFQDYQETDEIAKSAGVAFIDEILEKQLEKLAEEVSAQFHDQFYVDATGDILPKISRQAASEPSSENSVQNSGLLEEKGNPADDDYGFLSGKFQINTGNLGPRPETARNLEVVTNLNTVINSDTARNSEILDTLETTEHLRKKSVRFQHDSDNLEKPLARVISYEKCESFHESPPALHCYENEALNDESLEDDDVTNAVPADPELQVKVRALFEKTSKGESKLRNMLKLKGSKVGEGEAKIKSKKNKKVVSNPLPLRDITDSYAVRDKKINSLLDQEGHQTPAKQLFSPGDANSESGHEYFKMNKTSVQPVVLKDFQNQVTSFYISKDEFDRIKNSSEDLPPMTNKIPKSHRVLGISSDVPVEPVPKSAPVQNHDVKDKTRRSKRQKSKVESLEKLEEERQNRIIEKSIKEIEKNINALKFEENKENYDQTFVSKVQKLRGVDATSKISTPIFVAHSLPQNVPPKVEQFFGERCSSLKYLASMSPHLNKGGLKGGARGILRGSNFSDAPSTELNKDPTKISRDEAVRIETANKEPEVLTSKNEVPAVEVKVPIAKFEVPAERIEVAHREVQVPVLQSEVPNQKVEVPAATEVPQPKSEVPQPKSEVPTERSEVPARPPRRRSRAERNRRRYSDANLQCSLADRRVIRANEVAVNRRRKCEISVPCSGREDPFCVRKREVSVETRSRPAIRRAAVHRSKSLTIRTQSPESVKDALNTTRSQEAEFFRTEIFSNPSSASLPSASQMKVSASEKEAMENVGPENPVPRRKKIQHIDIHLHALFAAVEHGHLEKARTILETNTVNLNQVNSDGFSLLDVAYLGRNEALVRLLIAFGAQEGNKYCDGDGMGSHLRDLMSEAEVKLEELRGSLEQDEAAASALCASASASTSKSSATTAAATAAAAAVAEATKNYSLWERRLRGLRKMIAGFDQTRVPDPPSVVEAEVTQSTSVTVRFKEPDHQDTPVTTKFKVEWSKDSNFRNLTGSLDVLDAKQAAVNVENLTHGDRYFFRVACGNLKGFSPFKNSMPASVIPSSWRDISQKEERLGTDKIELLEDLFNEIRIYRPDIEDFKDPSVSDSQAGQRKKKTTIKQLFTATSKFQKHLRRGVFLSSLFYHEDKVLVTNEEFLPVIEVDETYPGALNHDFHWFLKVSCTWEDIKWMKNDMEKSLNSSSVHFRVKLLTAAMQMQAALGVQDLGQLYHRILKDTDGTTIICTINYCRNPKNISVLNSKWLPLGKIMKRTCMIDPAGANVSELLMFSIQEQITYHQVSSMKLQRGLYLGYLKMRSSVDLLYVIVPTKTPNVPPHCKIRANPHVTAEEWDWLVNGQGDASNGTEQQKLFADQIAAAAERLFTYMQVLPEHINQHRFYDIEVVEMSADVSLLMVIPPIEVACAPPGQKDFPFPRNDMIALPVPVFETAYLQAYQKLFISRYSRLSCIFELNTALAQHSHREAFSNSEVAIAKERLTRLEALQSNLSDCWKSVRWLMDMLNFARDRNSPTPTVMKQLLATHPRNPSATTESPLPRQLLEPPVPGPSGVRTRGSWPGPGIAKLLGTATAELSRSEQQLSYASCSTTSIVNPPTVIPTRPPPPIPIINPIMVPSCSTSRLPPSKSEDTLAHHASCSRLATPPLLHNTPGGSMLNVSGSLRSLSSDESVSAVRSKSEGEEDGVTMPTPSPGILQVYAAYETGLAAGTSLKLHVSPRTTAREVVDLVVKQLNMAVVFKGKGGPIYPNDQLSNFCLVAVIGARERCLRDDFKLLQLQNPWKKGRLYVRQKQDVLAALEHSSRYIVPLK